jgi:hypothetical protein
MADKPPEGAMPDMARMDPRKADVGTAKPRRRKLRKQTPPPADLTASKPAAEKRIRRRPTHPMIMLEPAGMNREHMIPLHDDERLHDLQLAEAFGTRSYAVINTFLRQFEDLCSERWWDEKAQQWRLNEATFNTILALVGSLKPRNEMEAAFAAQMAAVYMLSMKVAARAIRYDHDTKTAATAAKLAQTFTNQMQEFRAMRGKTRTTRQNIKVTKELHQHVHYHDARGAGETGGQPHGRNDGDGYGKSTAADQRTALPSQEQGGHVVPLPSRAR